MKKTIDGRWVDSKGWHHNDPGLTPDESPGSPLWGVTIIIVVILALWIATEIILVMQ